MERIIEICCGSYEDALNAYHGGAKRIELNSALYLGGLTPSLASLKLTKKNTNLKVITMVRPRGAGFCYNEIEFEVMKEDAKSLLENGADGIAFGCLNKDGSICLKQTKEMIEIIKSYQGEVVFHRAFDCVEDPYASIELLIELGAVSYTHLDVYKRQSTLCCFSNCCGFTKIVWNNVKTKFIKNSTTLWIYCGDYRSNFCFILLHLYSFLCL